MNNYILTFLKRNITQPLQANDLQHISHHYLKTIVYHASVLYILETVSNCWRPNLENDVDAQLKQTLLELHLLQWQAG